MKSTHLTAVVALGIGFSGGFGVGFWRGEESIKGQIRAVLSPLYALPQKPKIDLDKGQIQKDAEAEFAEREEFMRKSQEEHEKELARLKELKRLKEASSHVPISQYDKDKGRGTKY